MKRSKFAQTLGLASLVAGIVWAMSVPAWAQDDWPKAKIIKLVVPWPPGGVADYLARQLSESLPAVLGQSIIVENKAGAGTNIGSDLIAKSEPDGYSILIASSNNAANMTLFKKMPYDTAKDFAPVARIGYTPMVLVVTPSLPAKDLKQFIRYASENPGKITNANAGNGSPAHLAAAEFQNLAKVRLLDVSYKGASPAITDLLGGHVMAMMTNIPASIASIKSGSLRALAVTGTARTTAMPDVPTFVEAGLPTFEPNAWYGVVAPRGTPPAVVKRLADAIRKVLAEPKNAQSMEMQGVDLSVSTPEEFAKQIEGDIVKYRQLIQSANITIQ